MHAAVTMSLVMPRAAERGFTLIELMVVLTIVAILVAIGLPNMVDFIAEQRVRTVASDTVSEIMFARAKAVEQSRRVGIEHLTGGWNMGWRIFVDMDNSNTWSAGDVELKQFNGFGNGAASTTGRLYTCSTVGDFVDDIVFRPDGRVVRSATATTANDGIYVIDPMGDTDICNNKTRAILFDLSGRVNSRKITSGVAACPGVAPPC